MRGVNKAAPIIYVPAGAPATLAWQGRLVALLAALGCLTPLLIAAFLTPDPSGVGSHTEMGLARCEFLYRTGLPCPSCGMTTSWTWFAHGNLAASFYIQPMGTVLAILTAAAFWIALYVALTGRPVYRLLKLMPGRYYFLPLLSFALLAWGWKIFIHLSGRDGWH